MSQPAPPTPPAIDGCTALDLLGSGGYADVFLYEEHSLGRRVAVKVLREGVEGSAQQRQFTNEANLMARVSTHPYIVQIFKADVARDGRPYLMMEYYPGDNYLVRARSEHFSVADVLQVGVQVASAVETAHRAGIFHRDIKPANILTSEFGRPGLTDFGIAATLGPHGDDPEGLSIPWSPPEAIAGGATGAASDVYSLAATLYHLLVGHPPFEVVGGRNDQLALIERIETADLRPTGRADVPPSLERLLGHAMAKRPEHRPRTAAELGRMLQGIEAELHLNQTRLELAGASAAPRPRSHEVADDDTRVKGPTEIAAQGTVIGAVPESPVGVAPPPDRRREGLLAEPELSDTVTVAGTEAARTATVTPRRRRRIWWVLAGAGALVLVALATGFALRRDSSPSATTTTLPFGDRAAPATVAPIPPVEDLEARVSGQGSVTFTWRAPGALAGDVYTLTRSVDGGTATDLPPTSRSEIVLTDLATGAEVCLEVTATRIGAPVAEASRACITP